MQNKIYTREIIQNLLKQYGSDSLSYFYLQHGRQYFFSPSRNSCISYKVHKGIAVIGGDPLGDEVEIPFLLESFLNYLRVWKLAPLFVGVSNKYINMCKDNKLKVYKAGEEAFIDLTEFNISILNKKVRRAIRHINNLGVEIFFYNANNLPTSIKMSIKMISQQWLKGKGDKERGFSMTLRRIPTRQDTDCVFAVAIQSRKVIGYAHFVPMYNLSGYSLDHLRSFSPHPNGLHESIIANAAMYFKKNHIINLSLNFAAFTELKKSNQKQPLKNTILRILRKTYRCDSLQSFNKKFNPAWKDRYVAFSSMKLIPNYVFALLSLES